LYGILFCLYSHFFITPFSVIPVVDPTGRLTSNMKAAALTFVAETKEKPQAFRDALNLKLIVFIPNEIKCIDFITNCAGNYAILRWLKF
jgi:hypothetical protein